MDPHEAGAVLERLAAMELLAGLRAWGGEFQPGEELIEAIRDLAARLRGTGGKVAGQFFPGDVTLLECLTEQLRVANEPLVTDKHASDELRRNGARLLGLADQVEALAQWIRAGLEGPAATW